MKVPRLLILAGLFANLVIGGVHVSSAWISPGINLAPYTGNVATRTQLPTVLDAAKFKVMSRSEHISRDTISSLQIIVPNWYATSGSGELGSGNALTYTASVEYPAGTFTQILFSGSASVVVADTAQAISDITVVSIPTNTEYFIRMYQTGSTATLYNARGNPNVGDRIVIGASATDQTMSGTVANGQPAFTHFPLAIIASTTHRAVCGYGTSRTGGGGDDQSGTPGDLGFFAKPIGPNYAYITMGVSGDTTAAFIASHTKRLALAVYCTDVWIEYGVNDNPDAGHIATLKANLQTIYAYFPGKRVHGVTIPPQATNPGNVAIVDYTDINIYTRAGLGLYNVFDLAPVLGNQAIWINIAYAADTVHISRLGCLQVVASGLVQL